MRKRLALSGLILAFIAACAGSDGTDTERIRLTGFTVAEDPKVDVRYPAVLAYEANGGVQVIDSCFLWFDKNADFTSFRSTAWLGEGPYRSEEHTSELQSLMRISYAVFCLKKNNKQNNINTLRHR